MNKKKKLSFVLAGVLLFLSLLFFATGKRGKVEKTIFIKALDEASVVQLSIGQEEGAGGLPEAIDLYREGETFKLGKQLYDSDEKKTAELFEFATGEFELELISSSGSGYARYGLSKDELREVILYDKAGSILRKFSLGKSGHRSQSRFLLLDEDENVYQSYSKFGSLFHVGFDELRDKYVLSFDRTTVGSLRLSTKDTSLFLKKEEAEKQSDETLPPEISWLDENNQAYQALPISDILNTLSSLRAGSFYYPPEDAKQASPSNEASKIRDSQVMKLELEAESSHTLLLYEEDEKSRYPAALSEEGEIFFLSRSDYNRLRSLPSKVVE